MPPERQDRTWTIWVCPGCGDMDISTFRCQCGRAEAVEVVEEVRLEVAERERDRLREALAGLVECFDGMAPFGTASVMNEVMPWEDVEPRVGRARAALSTTGEAGEEGKGDD